MRVLLTLLLLLPACTKTPEPAKLLDFHTDTPGNFPPACVETNTGKRFIVEGYVGPGGDISVTDGLVNLDIAEATKDGDVDGKSFNAEFKEGTHVRFDVANRRAKAVGALATGSQGELEGVTLITTTGDATPSDKLAVVFDYDVIKHFQTGAITACMPRIVELRKL